ncbi:MAG: hypothetical protein ACTHKL_06905 [Streptosporangiaceae bacterium]
MRTLSALALLLAAAVTVAACTGPGAAVNRKRHAAHPASLQTVGCDQIIQQAGPPSGRLVLGVLEVPPAHLKGAAPTASRPWAYFAKYGIAVRAYSPAVVITVPKAWRDRAAAGWGNVSGASSLRLAECPRQLGAWNAYAGGFYLRSASGCVPLVFKIGRHAAALSFAIGGGTCGSAAQVLHVLAAKGEASLAVPRHLIGS